MAPIRIRAEDQSMANRTHSAGLRRDLELLQVLAGPQAERRGGLGVVQIATLAGREKTQVSRALHTLADAGLVQRDPDTLSYRLGWRLYTLAAQTFEAYLVEVSTPFLRTLVDRVQETAHLCVLRGDRVLTLTTQAPAAQTFRVSWDGALVSAPATSAGRVLLSGWDDDAVRSRFTPERLRVVGGRRVFADAGALLTELAGIRARGYAVVDEDFDLGVVGCSAPVRDGRGRIVAAVNVGAPKSRLGGRSGRRLEAAGRLTARVAGQLSTALSAAPAAS
jgi:DNA-binding IclR family transcriptional regulator